MNLNSSISSSNLQSSPCFIENIESCLVSYETTGIAGKHEKIKLTYLDKLYNLNIDIEVINWIRDKIELTNDIKISKINDEHLYTYIYSGYNSLKIPCDPIGLAKDMNINLSKSQCSKMLSGTYGNESCLSNLSTTTPIIVISPKNYIREIITFFLSHFDKNENFQNIEKIIYEIECFVETLCNKNRFLKQENPKNMAAAVCFYYISLKNKEKISKSLFIDKNTNERLFTKCLNQIKETYESL